MGKVGCVQHDCVECQWLRKLIEDAALDMHTYRKCLPPEVAARFEAIIRQVAAIAGDSQSLASQGSATPNPTELDHG